MSVLSNFAKRLTGGRVWAVVAILLACLAVGFTRRRTSSDVQGDIKVGEELDRLVKDTLDETETVRKAIDKAHTEMREVSTSARKKAKKIQELAPDQAEDEWNAQVEQYNRRRTDK